MWSDAHRPPANPHHSYTMRDITLGETNEEKDLGIMINKSLKVSSECVAAAKKVNRALGMIRRNLIFKNRAVILKLYKSLVRPHLDYCMQVWNQHFGQR